MVKGSAVKWLMVWSYWKEYGFDRLHSGIRCFFNGLVVMMVSMVRRRSFLVTVCLFDTGRFSDYSFTILEYSTKFRTSFSKLKIMPTAIPNYNPKPKSF